MGDPGDASGSGFGPVPGLPRLPTPAEVAARLAPRDALLIGPPPYERAHCVDTGVGLAFACVDMVGLLTEYIGEQDLVVVSEVVVEVRVRARTTLEPGHQPLDRTIQEACRRLETAMVAGVFTEVELAEEFLVEVERVRAEVAAGSPSPSGHDGEAASIVWARSRRPRAVLLTNDGGAQTAAEAAGLVWRNAAQVMAALVNTGVVDASDAFELIRRMDDVSRVAGPFPTDARWRTADGRRLV